MIAGRLSASGASVGLPGVFTTMSPTSSVNIFLPIVFSACASVKGRRSYRTASSMPPATSFSKAASASVKARLPRPSTRLPAGYRMTFKAFRERVFLQILCPLFEQLRVVEERPQLVERQKPRIGACLRKLRERSEMLAARLARILRTAEAAMLAGAELSCIRKRLLRFRADDRLPPNRAAHPRSSRTR